MSCRESIDQKSPFSPPPWSGVAYRLSKQWKIPVLVVSLGSFQPAFGFQDAPASSPVDSAKQLEISRAIKEAEGELGDFAASDTGNRVLPTTDGQRFIESARRIGGDADRTEAFSKLATMLGGQKDFSSAREAALEIDQTALVERTRALISVARAEEAADQNEKAWLTLREAQVQSLKLRNPEQLIALMREIGDVERSLRADAASAASAKSIVPVPASTSAPADGDSVDQSSGAAGDDKLPSLHPEPQKVIEKVLAHGLPPVAYEEVELLNEGGGLGRAPRSIYHSYYYNGDRIFQGPMFPGGPTDVHVIHPRTGDGCVFRVNMPTGTPFIEYDESSIEYYFPDIVVELNFRRSGGYDIDYRTLFNKYDREHRKFRDRQLRATDSAFGVDPASVGDRLLKIGQSGPLSLAGRLPFLSNLLNRDSKRVPGTLTVPK